VAVTNPKQATVAYYVLEGCSEYDALFLNFMQVITFIEEKN